MTRSVPRMMPEMKAIERNSSKRYMASNTMRSLASISLSDVRHGRIHLLARGADQSRHGDELVAALRAASSTSIGISRTVSRAVAAAVVQEDAAALSPSRSAAARSAASPRRGAVVPRAVASRSSVFQSCGSRNSPNGDVVQLDASSIGRTSSAAVGSASALYGGRKSSVERCRRLWKTRCVAFSSKRARCSRNRADVRMRVAVVPDLVALGPDAPHEIRVALGVLADEEERRLHVAAPSARRASAPCTARPGRRRS